MYLRLAFAVAAHLEPEILLVDEVLAVGDASFQKRCLGKMNDVAREGRTVIFVSHNLQAIQRLCSHAVMLEAGQVAAFGDTSTVVGPVFVSRLPATGARRPNRRLGAAANRAPGRPGSSRSGTRAAAAIEVGTPYPDGPLEFALEIESDAPRDVRSLSVFLLEQYGTKVLNADTLHLDRTISLRQGRNTAEAADCVDPPAARNLPGGPVAGGPGAGPVGDRRLRLRRVGLRDRGASRAAPAVPAGTGALVTCDFEVEELS